MRRAARSAWCWVLSAVLGASFGVLRAECKVLAEQPTSPATLPEGDGAEVVRSRCLVCHGSDLIASQRLDDAGWGREVDKMVRWERRWRSWSANR